MTASTAIVEMKEEGENSLQNCYINGLLQNDRTESNGW